MHQLIKLAKLSNSGFKIGEKLVIERIQTTKQPLTVCARLEKHGSTILSEKEINN